MEQFTRGGAKRCFCTELLLQLCKYMCTIQFVWRDSGYIHAGTIRTWIGISDMVEDVLDMVNCVADSHSIGNELDTYDTVFRGSSSCSVASFPATRCIPPTYRIQTIEYCGTDNYAHCCRKTTRTGLLFKHVLRRNQVHPTKTRVRIQDLAHLGPCLMCHAPNFARTTLIQTLHIVWRRAWRAARA
jgi:hypothetical protein